MSRREGREGSGDPEFTVFGNRLLTLFVSEQLIVSDRSRGREGHGVERCAEVGRGGVVADHAIGRDTVTPGPGHYDTCRCNRIRGEIEGLGLRRCTGGTIADIQVPALRAALENGIDERLVSKVI